MYTPAPRRGHRTADPCQALDRTWPLEARLSPAFVAPRFQFSPVPPAVRDMRVDVLA